MEKKSRRTSNEIRRFGSNWHLKATRGFDIINDSEFTNANKVFGAKCVDLKRQELAKIEHKPPICGEDLKKLYESIVRMISMAGVISRMPVQFSNSLIIHAALTQPEHHILVRWMGLETQRKPS